MQLRNIQAARAWSVKVLPGVNIIPLVPELGMV